MCIWGCGAKAYETSKEIMKPRPRDYLGDTSVRMQARQNKSSQIFTGSPQLIVIQVIGLILVVIGSGSIYLQSSHIFVFAIRV